MNRKYISTLMLGLCLLAPAALLAYGGAYYNYDHVTQTRPLNAPKPLDDKGSTPRRQCEKVVVRSRRTLDTFVSAGISGTQTAVLIRS